MTLGRVAPALYALQGPNTLSATKGKQSRDADHCIKEPSPQPIVANLAFLTTETTIGTLRQIWADVCLAGNCCNLNKPARNCETFNFKDDAALNIDMNTFSWHYQR